MMPDRHKRSLAFVVARRVALVTTLVCAVVFSLIYFLLARQSQHALQETVDTDLAGLVDIYTSKGPTGLANALQGRLDMASSQNESPLYLLLDANGLRQVGNVPGWPKLDAAHSMTGIIRRAPYGNGQVRVTLLRGGYRLLVGRSDTMRENTLRNMRVLFIIAFSVLIFAAYYIGLYSARQLHQRVLKINSFFNATGEAALQHVPLPPNKGDEIDELSDNIAGTLGRVQRLLIAQRDISDHIAHETRTPLIGLEQSLTNALDRSTDTVAVHNLERGKQQVQDILRLMDALLDIASAEAQRGDLMSLKDINLSLIATGLVELYAASAEEAKLDFKYDIDDDVIFRADPMQMSRMMVNMFDNAFKHGAQGKSLYFSLKRGPIIVLEDDGIGIADTDKPNIFNRYMRSANVAAQGHGLGLALVRAIAERHGLGVHVEDKCPDRPHKGTRFIIAPRKSS